MVLDVQIAVLAGGLGTKLRPMTEEMPKCMIPIRNKPFLQYQIELFKQNNIKDIVLCIGYKSEKVMDRFGDGSEFDVNIRYSVEDEGLLGTAGALKKAAPLLDEVFLLIYGDSYLMLNFKRVLDYFRKRNKLGLMVVYKNVNKYGRSDVALENGYIGVYDKNRQTGGMVYINYGLSALRKKALNSVPDGKTMSLQDFYKILIERRELLAYEVCSRFYEVGSFEGLKEFRQLVDSSSGENFCMECTCEQ